MWKALIKLIEKWSCMHQWNLAQHINYVNSYTQVKQQITTVYCCTKCGKFKKINHY